MKRPRLQQDFDQRQAAALEDLRNCRQFVLITTTAEPDEEIVPMTFTVFCDSVFLQAATLGLLKSGPADYVIDPSE